MIVSVSVDLLTTKYEGIEVVALFGTEDLTASGSGVRNILVGNDGNNLISGLGGNDWLIGNDGNDTLNGGVGIDRMEGDLGNDVYFVDNVRDVVSEDFGGAGDIDTVKSTISFALGAGLEHLELLGKQALIGFGNELDNSIAGNVAANKLNGWAGADTLIGGGGNDTYFLDSLGDDVVETDGSLLGGIDLIVSAVDYALGANEERLILLAGSSATIATGNGLDNILVGNALQNTLDGGLGIDRMFGGAANDLYRVDTVGDLALEMLAGAKGGIDTVESKINYALGANLERLTLIGDEDINGTGNALFNVIAGNNSNNKLLGGAGNDTLTGGKGDDTLDGGAGNDSLSGGDGNDIYVVNSVGDLIVDSSGIDTVQAGLSWTLAADLEYLQLLGTGVINGTGNGGDNVITGNAGGNILTGGLGSDTVQGGAGNDRLFGGDGLDSLDGGVGNDIVIGGAGGDSIDVGLGNDRLSYTSVLDAGDTVANFDGSTAGGQDQVNLDLLLDSLAIAGKDRATRVEIVENGATREVHVDADGNTDNGFELLVVTLNTADAITIGADVILGN